MTARSRGGDADVHGALVVDKPAGPTSHDVVDRARRSLGTRRVGHTGTLDPFATGVLVLCIGKATRLARFLAADEKDYRATVRLGVSTTTDDLTGEPLGPARSLEGVGDSRVREVCAGLVGEMLQVPPAFSARRVAGRRLYELARAGEVVERRASPVTIRSLDVLSVGGDRVELDVSCSAGTYVRSLARDLGERLGVGAHLEALRRTRAGLFDLSQAVSWEDLGEAAAGRVLPLTGLLTDLPAVTVAPRGMDLLRHGRDLPRDAIEAGFPDAPPPRRLRVLGPDGALLALAVPRGFEPPAPDLPLVPLLHPDVVLLGGEGEA
jgi:tRNA pseudouridine55 synthase